MLTLLGVAFSHAASPDLDALLAQMTLREKIGQLNFSRVTEPGLEAQVRAGEVGGLLNARDAKLRERFEHVAVDETRLHIPLLHGADVIHGYRTVFPIPLGQAAAWNPTLSEAAAQIAAREASAAGIRWTFSPMVDIARDPRWGRIAEGNGEDPYLGSVLGAAIVRGYQGPDLRDPTHVAACPKHYAGYGASEGGRDYNTVDVSEATLRNVYLPPFRACFEAGAPTVMAAFSDVSGTPATASSFLLRQVLRDEWGFRGFVVSDAKAIEQLINHGLCETAQDAARAALTGGMDVEIISTCYHDHLEELVREGLVPETLVTEAARRVLQVKAQLGLFEQPYTPTAAKEVWLAPASREAAREFARQSLVLLKQDGHTLPLTKSGGAIAVIGPLADAAKDQLGCWNTYGSPQDAITPLTAIRQAVAPQTEVRFAAGLSSPIATETTGFEAAVRAAQGASVAVLFLGEPANYSGEAHNRAYLTLPGAQLDLLKAVHATGTPVVVVLLSARPLELGPVLKLASGVIMAWHPGTLGGPGIADVLFGDYNPSGKLPISWPRTIGQVPIHYNHENSGRPNPTLFDPAINEDTQLDTKFVTGYVDLPIVPQFPFGYGLSYTSFAYADVHVDRTEIPVGGTVKVSARLTNTGARAGVEVAQLYVRDLVASSPRPVRELKGFQRVQLAPGESKTVEFTLSTDTLRYWSPTRGTVIEPGRFQVWVGGDSACIQSTEFRVK